MMTGRWYEKCVVHCDDNDASDFFADYFKESSRTCLVIGGVSFDPRSSGVIKYLHEVLGSRLTALVIMENRSSVTVKQKKRTESRLAKIRKCCAGAKIIEENVDIFAPDNAVIGGRKIVNVLHNFDYTLYTDIVLDMSALSPGISFSAANYIYQYGDKTQGEVNIHLVSSPNQNLDKAIQPKFSDIVSGVHGFGKENLMGDENEYVLWLPVLTDSEPSALNTIYKGVNPDDIYPILPFPSEDTKIGDHIAYQVFQLVRSDFSRDIALVEPQNFLYSDERQPLDIYRSLIRLKDKWKEVFEASGKLSIILSLQGGKTPSIGVLMAALDCKFPVIYIEALSYTIDDWNKVEAASGKSRLVHVWLSGKEAYGTIQS